MCEAIRKMKEESMNQGISKGMKRGIRQGMEQGVDILIELIQKLRNGETVEELRKSYDESMIEKALLAK